ncbi:helix-turn-helix domain-containing protein [Cytobacillus horneckiae]|uniref:helix-turn-helix domain-containing protein n=1 Tax=Cytobacillus horneckiae TaxID=549687 RepID=UPI003D9A300A
MAPKISNLLKPRKNRIVVLEDLNFVWDEPELMELAELWEEEYSVMYISAQLSRDPDEVIIGIIHLAREDLISQRRGGLLNGL